MPVRAFADCTLGTGTRSPGVIIYNSTTKIYTYCSDTTWRQMNSPGSGSGGCPMPSGPNKPEGSFIFNVDYRVLQGCAGNRWMAMGPIGGYNQFASVEMGASYGCGLKNDGSLWCWGDDNDGWLGNGAPYQVEFSPVEVSGNAKWMKYGLNKNNCGIRDNNTMWCWGYSYGPAPVQKGAGSNWIDVHGGYLYECAIKDDGGLYCWYNNGTPTLLEAGPYKEVELTGSATKFGCAIKTDETLWCWGGNGSKKLGIGNVGNQQSPVQVASGSSWKMVSTGGSHTCGIHTDNTLWCWGSNSNSQLGDGTTVDSNVPLAVFPTERWRYVGAGSGSTCAIRTDGSR